MENASAVFLEAVRKSMRAIRTTIGGNCDHPGLLIPCEIGRDALNTIWRLAAGEQGPSTWGNRRSGGPKSQIMFLKGGCSPIR